MTTDIENKEKEIQKNTTNSLVLEHNSKKTSVFLHNELVFCTTEEKPFIKLKIQEKDKRKKEIKIEKTIPLKCEIAEIKNNEINMVFQAKGKQVKITIKEFDGNIVIKIKKGENTKAKLFFPRGTNEQVSYINETKKEKESIFRTKISNFYSSKANLTILRTAKEWDINVTEKEKEIEIKGEKAKIIVIYGKDKEETLNKYYKVLKISRKKEEKKEIYINVNEVNYIKKIKQLIKAGVPFDGVVWKKNKDNRINQEIIKQCKEKRKKAIVKIIPYIKTNEKNKENEKHLVRNEKGKLFTQLIEKEKHYAINLANIESRRWMQNKLREVLENGVDGFIAEKGKIDYTKISLPKEEKYEYGDIWYILWQKSVREVVDEYPNKILIVRNNGTNSCKYGKILTDECSWKEISQRNMVELIKSYEDCGMGKVAVEIGGNCKKHPKTFIKAKKWFDLIQYMPFVIVGDMPARVIKRHMKRI